MDDIAVANSVAAPADPAPTHHLKAYANGDDDPSFKDVLDAINPLQHIPVINTLYRKLTGDECGSVARVFGGALYGGPLGMALSTIDSIIDDKTGKDTGQRILAALTGEDDEPDQPQTQLAQSEESKPHDTSAPEATPTVTPPTDQPANLIVALPAQPVAPEAVTVAPLAGVKPATTTKPTGQLPAVAAAETPSPGSATPLPQGAMPVPARHAIQVMPPTPPNTYISNSSQASSVPAAGRTLVSNSLTDTRGLATPQNIAKPDPNQPVVNPWLPDAMSKALDKYEKMRKLTEQTAQAPVPSAASTASQPQL